MPSDSERDDSPLRKNRVFAQSTPELFGVDDSTGTTADDPAIFTPRLGYHDVRALGTRFVTAAMLPPYPVVLLLVATST
jgi:hypothetical protein